MGKNLVIVSTMNKIPLTFPLKILSKMRFSGIFSVSIKHMCERQYLTQLGDQISSHSWKVQAKCTLCQTQPRYFSEKDIRICIHYKIVHITFRKKLSENSIFYGKGELGMRSLKAKAGAFWEQHRCDNQKEQREERECREDVNLQSSCAQAVAVGLSRPRLPAGGIPPPGKDHFAMECPQWPVIVRSLEEVWLHDECLHGQDHNS